MGDWRINNNTMKDYILVRNKIPVESEDVIYSAESVVELLNDGFYLAKDERFIEYNINTITHNKNTK